MKLKKQYSKCSLSKRINGVMLTFNVANTPERDYEFYYKNGFEECFEVEVKEEVREVKTIEFKNDIETPIIVLTEGDAKADLEGTRRPDNHIEPKKKKYDTPNDNRKKK
jgi:hypothetical protein